MEKQFIFPLANSFCVCVGGGVSGQLYAGCLGFRNKMGTFAMGFHDNCIKNLCLSLSICTQWAYVTLWKYSISNSSVHSSQFAANSSGATMWAWPLCTSGLIKLQPSYDSKWFNLSLPFLQYSGCWLISAAAVSVRLSSEFSFFFLL